MIKRVALLAVLAIAPAAGARPAAAAPAKDKDTSPALIDRVQRFYDKTQDLTADFIQIYTRVALSRTQESRGMVKLKKPGMMRWDYTKPATKVFVADGKQLFIYEPEE